ncbi:MAG TPA: hypothetical protein VFA09_14120, partial [Ktedonobacteraceae bacterium]|nr:hypothetical protein [Ktedonobacteraceae bacterium]
DIGERRQPLTEAARAARIIDRTGLLIEGVGRANDVRIIGRGVIGGTGAECSSVKRVGNTLFRVEPTERAC